MEHGNGRRRCWTPETAYEVALKSRGTRGKGGFRRFSPWRILYISWGGDWKEMVRPIYENLVFSKNGELCVYFTCGGLQNQFFLCVLTYWNWLQISRGTLFTIKLWAALRGIERAYLYTQLSDCWQTLRKKIILFWISTNVFLESQAGAECPSRTAALIHKTCWMDALSHQEQSVFTNYGTKSLSNKTAALPDINLTRLALNWAHSV